MQESNTSRQKCGQGGRYVLHSKNKKHPVSQVMRNWEWKPPREPTANKNGKKKKKETLILILLLAGWIQDSCFECLLLRMWYYFQGCRVFRRWSTDRKNRSLVVDFWMLYLQAGSQTTGQLSRKQLFVILPPEGTHSYPQHAFPHNGKPKAFWNNGIKEAFPHSDCLW